MKYYKTIGTLILLAVALQGVGARPQGAATGSVTVATVPEGAAVAVNRQAKGTSPVTLALPAGATLVTVTLDGFVTASQTVDVREGVSRMVSIPLEPVTGTVLIHSEPSGAAVVIADARREAAQPQEGSYKGVTPLLLADQPLGTYRMTLTKPGYLARQTDYALDSSAPKRVVVPLTSETATLHVESTPAGAEVLVGGDSVGVTPIEVGRIPSGEFTIELRLDGYQVYRKTLQMSSGDEDTLSAELVPRPATLRIVTIPEGARIYVDNQFRGLSPVTLEEMAPGTYRVRAELEAHDTMARNVIVEPKDGVVEEFRLVSNCGTLQVSTTPAGVTVWIDGKERGTTTSLDAESDQVSQPLLIPVVTVGEHEIALTRKGYADARKVIVIARDRTEIVTATLERRFIPDHIVRTRNNTYRGVLLDRTPDAIRLETAPGVTQTFPATEIISDEPIRTNE
ncbi:MAG: PEGA domain-containing protein [Kiritimatiellaeota bacterium]|nr:PEGA domain-containing protein [Kiritimatiellota bacterium]